MFFASPAKAEGVYHHGTWMLCALPCPLSTGMMRIGHRTQFLLPPWR